MATTQVPAPAPAEAPSEQSRAGLVDYLTTVDHKKIGILYLYTAFGVFFAGGILAMLVRAELAEPGLQYMGQNTHNQVTTGLANYFIPLHIGAADVAFPRMNAASYWLYLFGSLIVLSSFFVAGGSAAAGWTAYPPLSDARYLQGTGMDLWIIGLLVVGLSGILGSINLLTTIFRLRAPAMTMFRIPMFVWTVLVNQLLILLAFPALTAALARLFLGRQFGAGFFNPDQGGTPVLYLHIFWFFGHPEVYIIILPVFGIISEVTPVFSRKPLFGYRALVFATFLIAGYSFTVWAHHMFTTGQINLYWFSIRSFIIAVPPASKSSTGWPPCGAARSGSPPRCSWSWGSWSCSSSAGSPGCSWPRHRSISRSTTPTMSSPTSTTSWLGRCCSACSPASTTGSPR